MDMPFMSRGDMTLSRSGEVDGPAYAAVSLACMRGHARAAGRDGEGRAAAAHADRDAGVARPAERPARPTTARTASGTPIALC